jgi:hypothetical protein
MFFGLNWSKLVKIGQKSGLADALAGPFCFAPHVSKA